MPTDWNKIAKEAADATDEHFAGEIAKLTRLNDEEIRALIEDSGISKENLVVVLKEVRDATKSNQQKAAAIKNVNKGIDLLVSIAGKLL